MFTLRNAVSLALAEVFNFAFISRVVSCNAKLEANVVKLSAGRLSTDPIVASNPLICARIESAAANEPLGSERCKKVFDCVTESKCSTLPVGVL